MTGTPDVEVVAASPAHGAGHEILVAYFRDIAGRHYRRPATDDEVSAAMSAEPSDDLCPPRGIFVIARQHGDVVGCAGVRLLGGGTGELTRVYVVPAARRRGIGELLVRAMEARARQHAVTRLRLDTHSDLTEARQLYAKNGYREVPPFNDGRYADHWYEKTLA